MCDASAELRVVEPGLQDEQAVFGNFSQEDCFVGGVRAFLVERETLFGVLVFALGRGVVWVELVVFGPVVEEEAEQREQACRELEGEAAEAEVFGEDEGQTELDVAVGDGWLEQERVAVFEDGAECELVPAVEFAVLEAEGVLGGEEALEVGDGVLGEARLPV